MQELKIEEAPPPETNGTSFKRFLKVTKPGKRHKETCEVILLIVATVVTLCINGLPTIIFFTVEVSAVYAALRNIISYTVYASIMT